MEHFTRCHRFYALLESFSTLRWCILVGRKEDDFYNQNLQFILDTL